MRTVHPLPSTLGAILALLVLSGTVGLEIGPGVVTIGANLYGRVFYLEVGRWWPISAPAKRSSA